MNLVLTVVLPLACYSPPPAPAVDAPVGRPPRRARPAVRKCGRRGRASSHRPDQAQGPPVTFLLIGMALALCLVPPPRRAS